MAPKYIAIGIYLVVLTLITAISSIRKNSQDFLIASRAVGWQRLGIAIFASLFSSYNLVLGITFSYLFGPWCAVIYLGVLAAFIAIFYLFKRGSRETAVAKGYITIIDYFADRFGMTNANILNLSLMVVLFIFIGLQFFINTSVFSNIFSWDKYTSALLVGVIVLLYTLIGGLKVSILTDVFQGILMLIIGGMVFLVDTSKITFAVIRPILTDKTVIIGALSLAASQFLTLLLYPELWQRVYASKSLKDLKKGLTFAWLLLLLIIIPQIIIGLSARATGGVADPTNIFYDVLKLASPTWYLPILSVALLAAFMSTLDAALFAIGAQFGKYGLWFKTTQMQEGAEVVVVRKTRYAITGVTVVALMLSLLFSDFLAAAFDLISLLTVISVAVLCALILKLSNKQVTAVILIGILCFVCMTWGGLVTNKPLTTLYPSFALVAYTVLQTLLLRAYKHFSGSITST
jgi:Na+/proline symporter